MPAKKLNATEKENGISAEDVSILIMLCIAAKSRTAKSAAHLVGLAALVGQRIPRAFRAAFVGIRRSHPHSNTNPRWVQTVAVGCFSRFELSVSDQVQFSPERPVITDPASAIKREVLQLIDLQIEALRQESSLDSSQLLDYQTRSARIRTLYSELDRIGRSGLSSGLPGHPKSRLRCHHHGRQAAIVKGIRYPFFALAFVLLLSAVLPWSLTRASLLAG